MPLHLKSPRVRVPCAESGNGQERLFLQAAIDDVRKMEPGESRLFPVCLEANKGKRVHLLFCLTRALSTEDDTCTFTVITADVAGLNHHRAQGRPPKMRFRTALELRKVEMCRVLDGAFWSFLYTAMTMGFKERSRKTPLCLFYELLLPFLCNASLDVAMAASELEWQAELEANEGTGNATDPEVDAPFRTPRRSDSGHYGVVRHAFEYLLRRDGVSRADYKEISLLVRLQMLRLAQHDLCFVPSVNAAQRRILMIACRQLAYKAVKLGSVEGSAVSSERLSSLRMEALAIQQQLDQLNGSRPNETPPPPPLVLCEADRHLLRPGMKLLLGDELLVSPSANRAVAAESEQRIGTAAALAGAAVIGFYFSASCAPPLSAAASPLRAVTKPHSSRPSLARPSRSRPLACCVDSSRPM